MCQLTCWSKLGRLYVPILIFRVLPPVGPSNPRSLRWGCGGARRGWHRHRRRSSASRTFSAAERLRSCGCLRPRRADVEALGAGCEVGRAAVVGLKQPSPAESVAPCHERARPDRQFVASRLLPPCVAGPSQANWQQVTFVPNTLNGVSARRDDHEVLR